MGKIILTELQLSHLVKNIISEKTGSGVNEPTPTEVRQKIKQLKFHKDKLENDGPWSVTRNKSHSEKQVAYLEKYLEKWGHLAKEWHGKGKNMPPDSYKPEERKYLRYGHSVTPKGELSHGWNQIKGKDLNK